MVRLRDALVDRPPLFGAIQSRHAAEYLELRLRRQRDHQRQRGESDQQPAPGVVNVLFADGSTRAIKETIAVPVWWALGTRSGGEAISSDAY